MQFTDGQPSPTVVPMTERDRYPRRDAYRPAGPCQGAKPAQTVPVVAVVLAAGFGTRFDPIIKAACLRGRQAHRCAGALMPLNIATASATSWWWSIQGAR